jgi:chromosome segregation ATPase
MSLFKTVIRVGAFTALAAGAVALIAGPHRTAALFGKAHGALLETIDENIDDPTALRAQLRELEAQYPERISDLRGDLAELIEQERQVQREKAISERVVALTERDLETLQPLIDEAQTASLQTRPGTVVKVRFDNTTLDVGQAGKRVQQIMSTRAVYANRVADASRDLGYLSQQRERLEVLLRQLETERAEFQSQIWQLDRQVDAIARNDRLIDLMEKRQETIEECSRYEAVSLDSLHARMAEVRSRQEAELEMLANDQRRLDYEEVARIQLDMQGPAEEPAAIDESVAIIEAPYASDEVEVLTATPRVRH